MKEVGSLYVDLANYVRERQDDYLKGDEGEATNLISTAVTRADELLLHVDKAQDMKADAQIITQLSEVTYKRVKVSSGDSNAVGVTLDQFTDRIKAWLQQSAGSGIQEVTANTEVDGEENDDTETAEQLLYRHNLVKLGDVANKYLNKVPTIDFMLGPIMQEKKRQTGRRGTGIRMRINEESSTNPANLDVDDMMQGEESNTRLIMEIYKSILEAYQNGSQKPIELYRVILNPSSFSQSVENLFYVSFLVRDGRLRLELEHQIPVISPVLDEEDEDRKTTEKKVAKSQASTSDATSGDVSSDISQVVIDLDIDSWQGLIEVMEIKTSFLSQRPTTV